VSTLTITEAAELVGVSPFTIRSWAARGYLRPVRPGAKPARYLEADVIECRYERMSRAEHDALDALWRQVLAHA
jgi:excisionase family DNA binding protein